VPLLQVFTELRDAGVRIPIVAMTGNVDTASIELYKSVGFAGVLAKPFSKVSSAGLASSSIVSRLMAASRISAPTQEDVSLMLDHFAVRRHRVSLGQPIPAPDWWTSLR
jgi:hypothetical protein